MAEVNIALASRNFQNGGNIMPDLSFQRQLAINYTENTIVINPGDIGRPMRSYKRPQIVECKLEKVPNYRKKWLPSAKNQNIQAEISEAATQEPFRIW